MMDPEEPFIAHEKVWEAWIGSNSDKYSVYVHSTTAGAPVNFGAAISVTRVQTRIGHQADISLSATLDILEHALQDLSVYKCVFLSGSCIPVKRAEIVYAQLIDNDLSSFFFSSRAQVIDRFSESHLLDHFTLNQIRKHSQWCIINRVHGAYLVGERDRIRRLFWQTKIPVECAFGTLLASNPYFSNIDDKDTMYTFWAEEDDDEFQQSNGEKPYEFSNLTAHFFMKYMIDKPVHYFAQKFARTCQVDGQCLLSFLNGKVY